MADSYLLLNSVSFRYIFGIPPLILVLLPVASSDCDISGKDGGAYQNVLMVNIDDLVCVRFPRILTHWQNFICTVGMQFYILVFTYIL